MKQILSLLLLITSTCLMSQTIAVQGVLRDAKGRTVADGTYQVTFSLYVQPTGGTALYAEVHPEVQTSQGLFTTWIGSMGVPDTLSSLPFDTVYYLGISIDGKAELEPRTELTQAAYASSVRGGDNQFPNVGDANIKTNLTIDLGDVLMDQGSLLLSKGEVLLDSGTITIGLGEIFLTDAGGAIRFSDGTILNSANGGTASSAENLDSVYIHADADLVSAGGIEFQIGVQPAMTIGNDGFVTMEAGLMLDSGNVLYRGDGDITLGHYYPSDSSITARMTLGYDSIVTFARNPQSLDSAEVDNDAFTLGYLKEVIEQKLTQLNPDESYDTSDPNDYVTAGVLQNNRSSFVDNSYRLGGVVGEGDLQGTVFARTTDSVYIAKYISSTFYLTYYTGFAWTSSLDFGVGYTNTQNMITAAKAYNANTLYANEWSYQLENNYPDWYLPSVYELKAVLDSLPAGFAPGSYNLWTSTNSGTSSGYYVITNSNGTYSGSSTIGRSNSLRAILIRKIPREADLNTYSTNTSNLVTWAYYNARMEGLERKIEQAKYVYLNQITGNGPSYTVGQETEGGTVFAVQDGYAYIAYEYNAGSSYAFSNSGNFGSGLTFGSGYTNTQAILSGSGTTNTSYIEGILRSSVNSFDDWFLPSRDELQSVFDNTNLASHTYSYVTSSDYGNGCAYVLTEGGSSSYNCSGGYVLLVRRVSTN